MDKISYLKAVESSEDSKNIVHGRLSKEGFKYTSRTHASSCGMLYGHIGKGTRGLEVKGVESSVSSKWFARRAICKARLVRI